MHRIAHHNFCVLNQTSLPLENSSLITEISFQKDDDILVCLDKLFLQDQISSIYLKSQLDIIQESNLLLFHQTNSLNMQENLSDSSNLTKALAFWDHLIEKEEEIRENEGNYEKTNILKKFLKVASQMNNHEVLMSFYKEVLKSDRIFIEGYTRDEEKQTFLHSEEVKLACEKNLKQIEIESLVNLHMKRLEELDEMYKDQFLKKQAQKKLEFHNLIEKLYKNCAEDQENQSFIIDSTVNISNKSGKSDGLGSRNEEIGEHGKELNKKLSANSNRRKEENLRENINSKRKEKICELKLCLGMQRKYDFKIKLRESNYKNYLIMKEEDLSKSLNKSSNEITNYIYGIGQKGLISIISMKTDEGKTMEKFLKFKSDLFFESFEHQIKESMQTLKNQKKIGINNLINQKEKEENFTLNNGDVMITKHGSLKCRIMFSIVYESYNDFQNDSFLNWFRKIIEICNENQIKSLCIPVELFFSGTLNNYYSIKSYGDLLMKIIKMIKREINNFSMQYTINHYIKNINILIPKGNENFPNLFERSKEILKNVFE